MARPFRIRFLLLVCCLVCLVATGSATAATLPAGFAENTIASVASDPSAAAVAVTWAPDGRIFIADRTGRVFVHNPGEPAGTTHLVLDIRSTVSYDPMADRGLMDIATDSDFASNHFLYLLYTVGTDNTDPKVSTLTRITVNPDNSVVGGVNNTGDILLGHVRTLQDTSSENGVCGNLSNTNDCIPSEGASHSVGSVRSAADGTLWVSNGDGHDFTKLDPLAYNALSEQTFRGKILHIDRNGNGLPGHPFCPADTDLSHVCTKLFAKGIRQPFRFTLRPDGGLVFGEVGENNFEELNLASGGEDFGWPCWEGAVHTPDPNYPADSRCDPEYLPGAVTPPALSYPHVPYPDIPADCNAGAPNGNAIIGGPTYMGDQYPAGYRGTIFFGDFICGWLDHASVSGKTVTGFEKFSDSWSGVDIEIAPDGNIAYVDSSGDVREIVYLPGNHAPTASASVSPKTGVAPLSVKFTGSGSDPDGDPITYDWDFGDGSPHSSAQNPAHVYSKPENWVATLTVSDNRGMSASASVPVLVTSTLLSKPRLRLRGLTVRLAPHGVLRGTFSSANSVGGVKVSLWKGRVGSVAAARTCRIWVRRFHQFKRRSCSQPQWMQAKLHRRHNRYTWTVKLSGRPRRGSYSVVLVARPRSGKLAPSTPKRLKLRVR